MLQRIEKTKILMASPPPHIVLFPFMSKGHTIPLLHLAHLLIHRTNAAVTVFTTRSNHPFISQSLSGLKATIIDLPFPENIPGAPPGIESTDKLPDISSWLPLARATKLMQPHFEDALLEMLPSVTFMVTDGFLWWTVDSAIKFDIPRLVYYGMGNYASAIFRLCTESVTLTEIEDYDELFMVPNFPWIKLRKNEFDPVFWMEPGSKDPHLEFIIDCGISVAKSYAILVNSFYELEQVFVDFLRSHFNTKMFCVGPLCLAETERPHTSPEIQNKPFWIEWLDKKMKEGKSVVYVAFGSQAEISPEQFQEIKDGLEKSEVNFLWVIRKNETELKDGYEERVKDRGLVMKEWVNQREILGHQSVQGFISHCGWGSVLEGICAKVPILAWPIMAEQPINVRFVVEQIKIGIMIETCDGHPKGFVKSEGLRKSVVELMEGEMGKLVRKNAKEYGEAAMKAMDEGGSSWNELNKLLNELHA